MNDEQENTQLLLEEIALADDLQPRHLKKLQKLVSANDITMINKILPIIKEKIMPLLTQTQWKIKKIQLGQQLQLFMFSMAKQIQYFHQQNQVLFPFWQKLKNKFIKVTKILLDGKLKNDDKNLRKNIQVLEAKERNKIFKECLEKNIDNDQNIISQKGATTLTQYILQYLPREDWRGYFDKASFKKSRQNPSNLELYNHKHMPKDYICCSQFFYKGFDLYNPTIDCYYDIQIIPSSNKINENILREIVVAFLNAKGGIILLDCREVGPKIKAQGISMSQLNKQQNQQRIMSFLQTVSPPITINKHIVFSFVPVLSNPEQLNSNSTYLKGQFVMRILVFPIEAQITYHYTINLTSYFYVRTKGKNKQLLGTQIDEFIVSRFKQNQNKICKHQHFQKLIVKPQLGDRIFDSEQTMKKERQKMNKKQQKKFKLISLLIIDKGNIEAIEKILKKQKIDHQIQQSFPKHNFRLSSTTYMLHHDIKFQKIKTYINSSGLKYAGNSKNVMVISTAKSLETIPLDHTSLGHLQEWLNVEAPQEKMKIEQRDQDFFLVFESIKSAIFMYFLLDSFQIKARFRKVPQKIEEKIKAPKR